MRGALLPALAAALLLAGCAAPALRREAPRPAAPPPAPPATRAAPSSPAAAVPDTVPSAEALAVLAGIPEPLAPEERTPAPAPGGTLEPGAADAGGEADVPVPARTPVLGERALPTAPDAAAAADTAPAEPGAPAPAAALADTCWRVQLAAWSERGQAERYLAAGRSQLAVPLAIELEAGLFKVRTSECLSGPAADALRRQAREAGFDGAFRFRGGRP